MNIQIPLFGTMPNSGNMTEAQYDESWNSILAKMDPYGIALNAFGAEVEDNRLRAEAAAGELADRKWIPDTYAEGDVVWSPTDHFIYRCKNAGLRATDPKLDPANWALQTKTGAGGSDTTTSAVDITLTSTSGRLQIVAMTAPGKKITAPVATTLDKGAALFVVKNVGLYRFAFCKNGGAFVCHIQPGQVVAFDCSDTSTAAGVLHARGQSVETIYDGNMAEVLNSVDSRFIAVEMMEPTRAICAFRNNADSFLYAVVLNYGAASGVPLKINNEACENISIAAQTSSQATVVYQTSTNVVKGYVLDVPSNTITPGGVATIDANSGGSSSGTALTALTATSLLCLYLNNASSTLKEKVLDIALSAITPGALVSFDFGNSLYLRAKKISPSKAITGCITSNDVNLRLHSITGSTPTPTGSLLAIAQPAITQQTFGLAVMNVNRSVVARAVDHAYGDMMISLIDISGISPVLLRNKIIRVGLVAALPHINAAPLDANTAYVTWTGGASLGVDALVVTITNDDQIVVGQMSERLEAGVTASNGYLACTALDSTHIMQVSRNASTYLSAKTIEVAL